MISLKTKIKSIIVIGICFFVVNTASAAELYFLNNSVAGEVNVDAIVTPGDEFINALEGEIIYDSTLLILEDISDGDSIVSMWIERPRAIESGVIKFSGIIPGGFGPLVSKEGKIVSLRFKPKGTGAANFSFRDYRVFLNSPIPTEVLVESTSLALDIKYSEGDSQPVIIVLDYYPPEDFKPEILEDPNLFGGRHSLIFLTQDKGSGISHYEVKEKILGLFGTWDEVESPYLLRHQSLFSIIEIKAIDKTGLERTKRIIPLRFWVLSLLLLISLCIIIYFVVKYIKEKFNFGRKQK